MQVRVELGQLRPQPCIGIMRACFLGAPAAVVSQRPAALGPGQLEVPAAHQLLQHRLLSLLACQSCTTTRLSWCARM